MQGLFALAYTGPGAPRMPNVPVGTALNPSSSADEFKCEICMLVAQNREDHAAGGECNGVEAFAETCAEVLRAFDLWAKWVNLWLRDLGCHKARRARTHAADRQATLTNASAAAVCSWITSPISNEPFCPAQDQTYRSPAPLPAREATAPAIPVEAEQQGAPAENAVAQAAGAAAWSSPAAVVAAYASTRPAGAPPAWGGRAAPAGSPTAWGGAPGAWGGAPGAWGGQRPAGGQHQERAAMF